MTSVNPPVSWRGHDSQSHMISRMTMYNELACWSNYDVIIADPPFPQLDENTVEDSVLQRPHREPKNGIPRLFPMVDQYGQCTNKIGLTTKSWWKESGIRSIGLKYSSSKSWKVLHMPTIQEHLCPIEILWTLRSESLWDADCLPSHTSNGMNAQKQRGRG